MYANADLRTQRTHTHSPGTHYNEINKKIKPTHKHRNASLAPLAAELASPKCGYINNRPQVISVGVCFGENKFKIKQQNGTSERG